jgi:hypothetical protein
MAERQKGHGDIGENKKRKNKTQETADVNRVVNIGLASYSTLKCMLVFYMLAT